MLLSLLAISLIPIFILSYFTIISTNESITATGEDIKEELITHVMNLYEDNINQQAELLVTQLTGYENQILQLKALAEEILENPSPPEDYSIDLTEEKDGYYWEEVSDDISNVGVSALYPLDDNRIIQIEATKKLEESFKRVYADNDAMVAVYYISALSDWRMYPAMDVKFEIESGFFPPDIDLTREIFYSVTDDISYDTTTAGWTKPYNDITHRDRMFTIAAPVFKDENQIGIVAADITIHKTVEHLINFDFKDNDSYAVLINEAKEIIAYQDGAETDLQQLTPSLLNQISAQDETFLTELNGDRKLFLSAKIEPIDWQIVLAVPERAITSHVTNVVNDQLTKYNDSFLNQTIAILLFILGLILIISFAFWTNFSRPIKMILQGIDTFQNERFDVSIPEQKLNEFNILRNSLNMMAERINELTNNYRQLNKELEKKVEKRTQQLQNVNTSLIKTNTMLSIMEQERKELLSELTHDLKTPLTLVTGYIEAMQHKLISEEDVDYYLERISSHLDAINKLIKDVNRLGKMDDVHAPLSLVPINTTLFFSELQNEFSAQENIQFTFGEHLSWIYADKYSLKRALLNLIENSMKYSDGDVMIHITVLEKDSHINIQVKDDGWGIAADTLPHIFNRHFRSNDAMLSNKSGEGIGLAIVKQIVENHRGKIAVESEYKKGTTFTMTLPVIEATTLGQPIRDVAK